MLNHLLFIGLILCFGYRNVLASIPGEYSVIHFNQKVDHFNYLNNQTFKQRVIIASDNYKLEDSPPIFLYCGNEGDIFTFVNNTGFMWEIQDKFKAVLVFIEHRYYGTSFPERSSKNDYSYLSVEQALTDFAVIIDDVRNTHTHLINSPVIAFGGSYGGMLAAWMRIKYPHIIEGALAASAPIIQFPGAYNCSDFNKIVTKDYEGYSSECAKVIGKTWPAIRRLGRTFSGLQFLQNTFQLCNPINSTQDLDDLINYFGDIITNVAMTDYPNPSDLDRCINEEMLILNGKRDSIKLTKLDILVSTFNIFSNYLCSKRFDYENQEMKKQIRNYDAIFWDINQCYPYDFLRWLCKFSFVKKQLKDLDTLCMQVRDFIEYELVIPRHNELKNNPYEEPESLEKCKDFLEYNLMTHYADPTGYNWESSLYQMGDLIGGNSAVGNVLYRLLGYLALNQQCQQRIYEEAVQALDYSNKINNKDEKTIRLNHKNLMVYTEASMMEALRLASSPIVPHVAMQDSSIGGYHVKKNTYVMCST